MIDNNTPVDIWHYPDSNKWGWTIGRSGFYFRRSTVNYYDGEE